MTPDIVATVKNQKYEDLFVNYQGVMFGNGDRSGSTASARTKHARR